MFESVKNWIKGGIASRKDACAEVQRGMDMVMNSKGDSGAILAGIMITIVGFATLMVGNYIIFSISTSLPAMASANYNTTSTSVLTYVTTVLPIFGLALMVLGFAIILYTLRTSMGGGSR